MKLRMALDDKMLDVRLRDRLVTEGKVSKEEVAKYLQSLPDDSANCIELSPTENDQE
jgi:hypothetical protein